MTEQAGCATVLSEKADDGSCQADSVKVTAITAMHQQAGLPGDAASR